MKDNKIYYELDALNKVTIAHMVNELYDKHNINLEHYKPTCGSTLQMVGNTFTPSEQYANQIDEFYARYYEEYEEEQLSLEISRLGICEFFECYFRDHSMNIVDLIAAKLKEIPSCDIIFNPQPDAAPFPASIIHDPESGMIIRSICGLLLTENSKMIVTDIHFLIVEKIREEEPGIYRIIK